MDGRPTGNLKINNFKISYQDKHIVSVELVFIDACGRKWKMEEKKFMFDLEEVPNDTMENL